MAAALLFVQQNVIWYNPLDLEKGLLENRLRRNRVNKIHVNKGAYVLKNKLFVCSSPHLRDNSTTQSIMLDVLIALLPATVAGILFFGLRAAAVIV